MTISAAQSRAARGLLNWTQKQLAEASGASLGTVVDFEREKRVPMRANREALQRAFETAGIEFIENGVRLRQST